MIDKRVIAIIVIFILGGLFIYSFANPISDSEENPTDNGGIVIPSEKDPSKEEKPTIVNKEALNDVKSQLENLNKEDYTEESWTLIQNLIQGAEKSTSQEEFDLLLSQIDLGSLTQKPIENPVPVTNPNSGSSTTRPNNSNNTVTKPNGSGSNTTKPVQIDKTALNNIKAQLAKLNKNDYTTESWNIVQAQVKVADLQTTQAGFNTAVSQINLGLLQKKPVEQPKVDKTELNNVKTQASSINKNDYTADSYKKLEDALNLPETTEAEVTVKTRTIQTALNGLQKKPVEQPKPVDKTELNHLKSQLSKYNKADYEPESYKKLEEASNLPEATQEQVNAKVESIQSAINSLKQSHYTVTFNNDNNMQSVTVKYGNKVEQPINPVKTGYTFLGWYSEDTKFDFNTNITDNVDLTAHWQQKSTASTFGLATGETANVNISTNGNEITYKGTMNAKNPYQSGDRIYYNYISIKVTSQAPLTLEEFNNVRVTYAGETFGKDSFHYDSATGIASFELPRLPFSPNYGGSSANLKKKYIDVYWGFGEETNYSLIFDIVVNEN